MNRSIGVALFAAAFALATPRGAHAYAWMIRHGYTSCATCHADPSGSGVLTQYGRAQGDILLQSRYGGAPHEEASASAGFLWGVVKTPDWILGGGDVRYMEIGTNVNSAGATWDHILMQADLAAVVQAGAFRAGASIGVVSTNGTPASLSGQLVSREHWLGYAFGTDDAWLVRAGRINVPFGVRSVEHTLWVRSTTRSDLNDTQQHGLALAYTSEMVRGEIMGIVGNYQLSPDEVRDRGYSGYVEFAPTTRLAAGISSRITHAEQDIRLRLPNTHQAHGVFVRTSPWMPIALLAEADLILESPTGAAGLHALATMLQADYEPWQGIHLTATGETLAVAGSGSIAPGGWLTATWFFAPHFDIRADVMNRTEVFGNQRFHAVAYMAQGHVYF